MSDVERPRQPKSRLGATAFVFGIVSLILAVIPYFGVIAGFFVGLTGLVLGIVAVAKKATPKSFGLLGLIFSTSALPVALVVSTIVSLGSGIGSESGDTRVTYSIDGDVETAEVTYQVVVDGTLESKSEEVSLPWTLTVIPGVLESDIEYAQVRIQASTGSIFDTNEKTLGCSIKINNRLEIEETTKAVNPKVSCVVE